MNARQMMTAISGTRDTPGFSGRCVYCGTPCFGKSCAAHRDLVLHEQQLMRSSAPTPASKADGAGTPTEGV